MRQTAGLDRALPPPLLPACAASGTCGKATAHPMPPADEPPPAGSCPEHGVTLPQVRLPATAAPSSRGAPGTAGGGAAAAGGAAHNMAAAGPAVQALQSRGSSGSSRTGSIWWQQRSSRRRRGRGGSSSNDDRRRAGSSSNDGRRQAGSNGRHRRRSGCGRGRNFAGTAGCGWRQLEDLWQRAFQELPDAAQPVCRNGRRCGASHQP